MNVAPYSIVHPRRVLAGAGSVERLGELAAAFGAGSEPRFAAMARAMGPPVDTLLPRDAGVALIDELYRFNTDLRIASSLRDKGIGDDDVDGLVEGACKVTRLLDNNPRPMTRDDMRAIYRRLM